MKNNNHFLTNSLLNIYERPSKKSSISSQIIFGEKFIILSKNKGWLKIKTACDNYKGYIRNPQFIKKFEPTHKIFKLKAKIYEVGIGYNGRTYSEGKKITIKDGLIAVLLIFKYFFTSAYR